MSKRAASRPPKQRRKGRGAISKRARLGRDVRELAKIRSVVNTGVGNPWPGRHVWGCNMATGVAYSHQSSVQLARKLNESFLIERHGKEQCPVLFAGFQQIKSMGGRVRAGARAFHLATFIYSPDPDMYGWNRTLKVFHYHQCVFPADSPIHNLYRAMCLSAMPIEDLSLKAICLRELTHQIIQLRHAEGPESERASQLEASLEQVHCKLPWPYYRNRGAEQVIAHYAPNIKWSQDPEVIKCGWDPKTKTLRLPEHALFSDHHSFYATVFLLLGKYMARELPARHILASAVWARAVCRQLDIDFSCAWHKGACRHPASWTDTEDATFRAQLDIPELIVEEEQ